MSLYFLPSHLPNCELHEGSYYACPVHCLAQSLAQRRTVGLGPKARVSRTVMTPVSRHRSPVVAVCLCVGLGGVELTVSWRSQTLNPTTCKGG